jgi:putative transcriptional regulator
MLKGNIHMKLGNTIRRCRFEKNETSQQELANAVGVTRQTIFSIEKSKFVPSALLALKIARFFNKSLEEVFFIIDDE